MTTHPDGIRLLRLTLLAGLLLATGRGRLSEAQPPAKNGGAATAAPTPTPQESKTADDGESDLEQKVAIMNSPRWRRAIFELGEWLSAQAIYTPTQVRNIKADFNHKVEKMSPHDLEYLLDDLDAKFKVLDTPEAQDARSWVAQYLSVMSDQRRAEALKDVPNVVTMTAGQLQQEIQKIEQKRGMLQQQQAAFDEGRQQLVQQAQDARQQTAAASAAAMSRTSNVSYSPYRGGGGGGGREGAGINPGHASHQVLADGRGPVVGEANGHIFGGGVLALSPGGVAGEVRVGLADAVDRTTCSGALHRHRWRSPRPLGGMAPRKGIDRQRRPARRDRARKIADWCWRIRHLRRNRPQLLPL